MTDLKSKLYPDMSPIAVVAWVIVSIGIYPIIMIPLSIIDFSRRSWSYYDALCDTMGCLVEPFDGHDRAYHIIGWLVSSICYVLAFSAAAIVSSLTAVFHWPQFTYTLIVDAFQGRL